MTKRSRSSAFVSQGMAVAPFVRRRVCGSNLETHDFRVLQISNDFRQFPLPVKPKHLVQSLNVNLVCVASLGKPTVALM
jgi:hypothetical protein